MDSAGADGGPLSTVFTRHLGYRVHIATFARPSKYLLHLALSVQRSGGALNVLGARDDLAPVPPEFIISDAVGVAHNHTFAYGQLDGKEQKELGYRRILFKRLLFLWRLAKQLPPKDLLLYVDGNDVLFQRPVSSAVSTWQELVAADTKGNEAVIFMGYPECGGRFDKDLKHVLYPLGPAASTRGFVRGGAACARWRAAQPRGSFPFLDSGGYLGRAGAVLEVLEDALELARLGLDYICMSALTVAGIRLGPSRLRVDAEAALFYSLRPADHGNFGNWTPETARRLCEPGYFDSHGLPPAMTLTGETPTVLHFVGPSKWYFLHRCMGAFLEQRRAELAGGVSVSPFAGLEGAFCRFSTASDAGGEPEEVCEGTWGTFVYFDVDRKQLIKYPMDLDMLGAAA